MVAVAMESLPLGFRFHPTDEELINHYLKGKISGRKPQVDFVISEIDVCKCEPWDLPDKSIIKTGDPEWFFFAPRDRKYPNGHRSNRATEAGYWKATGKDRKIKSRPFAGSALIGMKKTLVFYRGRAPKGARTCWIMHEYRTVDGDMDSATSEAAYVLCRLFKKQEEKTVSSNYDEIDVADLAQLQSKSSPCETKVEPEQEEDSEKEITQEINVQDMPLSKQQSDRSIKEQLDVFTWLADGVGPGIHPAKPEESYSNSNSNMTSDVADPEIEPGKMNGDEICCPLVNYPQPLSPMPLADSHVFENFDPQMSLPPFNDADSDDATHFLNSVLCNQDENFGNSVLQNYSNGDAFIDQQVDTYASDFPQSYHLGNVDNMVPMNYVESGGLLQAQEDFVPNPSIYQLPGYHSVHEFQPLYSLDHQKMGDAFYAEASINSHPPYSLQESSFIPETTAMGNCDSADENPLAEAEIQIRPSRVQNVSSSSSNRQGIVRRRIRYQKGLSVGSSLCRVSTCHRESCRNQASSGGMKNEQGLVLKTEESTGSVNLNEMGHSDDDEGLSAETAPNSKEVFAESTATSAPRKADDGSQHKDKALHQTADQNFAAAEDEGQIAECMPDSSETVVIDSSPASPLRKSGRDSQDKDIAAPQTADQKFMAAEAEGLSAESTPHSSEAAKDSTPALRLRKLSSDSHHKAIAVTRVADQEFKNRNRRPLLACLTFGAAVAAVSIVVISICFRF